MSGENSEDRNYEETTEEDFLETMLEWEDSGKTLYMDLIFRSFFPSNLTFIEYQY